MPEVRYDFAGSTAMVTGGGSGIGAALAAAFLDAGANVAVADINFESAARVVRQLSPAGGRAEAFAIDVADEASVRSAIHGIAERFGGLDIALNNAGIEADTVPLAELDSANFRRVTEVNMTSVFYCMKAEIEHMLARGGGVILNTASISGLIGGYRLSAYTATKHAVIGMTKCAAMEYGASGIRINALCPGLTDTPFIAGLPGPVRDRMIFGIPMGRPADPAELAAAALWLCSSGASYVTGHAMIVDGGVTAGETSTRFDDLMD